MRRTFAHYRNHFCMYRTYYALTTGIVEPDAFTMNVIELPHAPSQDKEDAGQSLFAEFSVPQARGRAHRLIQESFSTSTIRMVTLIYLGSGHKENVWVTVRTQ
jgi:hypothetical protein